MIQGVGHRLHWRQGVTKRNASAMGCEISCNKLGYMALREHISSVGPRSTSILKESELRSGHGSDTRLVSGVLLLVRILHFSTNYYQIANEFVIYILLN